MKNCVFISDLHAGAALAVCPPKIDNYSATPLQLKLYYFLHECYGWIKDELDGEPFTLILGSEIVEGIAPKLKTIGGGLTRQFKAARILLTGLLDHVKEKQLKQTFLLKGTEYHTGLDNDYENAWSEMMRDKLKIKPDKNGNLTRLVLTGEMDNGAILEATHQFNVTNIYELTAYQREYKETLKAYHEVHRRPPDILYRCHIHRFNWYPLHDHPLTEVGVFSTPGWSGKSQYVQKGLSRLKLPSFGLCMTKIVDGKVKLLYKIMTVTPTEELEKL